MNTLLKAHNVTKIYNNQKFPSLDGVSFSIDHGEFLGIMGASGSGKTTLLNVLSTIDVPTKGDIFINHVNLKKLNHTSAANFRRDNLGFIFQEYFLLDSLTIRENITVPLTLLKIHPQKIEKMVNRLSEKFGIADQLDKYPNALSGGQRQRASAARAIIKKPSILFADEPTGALDSHSATELLYTLKEINKSLKTTILMVTHDPYAASFANRILIFKDGQIIKELLNTRDHRSCFYESIIEEITQLTLEDRK